MKAFKKLAAAVLVCVMALTMLTACGGGSSSGGFSSAAFTKKVNDKLAAKGSSIVLQNDDAMVKKANDVARIMNISSSDVKNMTDEQKFSYFFQKLFTVGTTVKFADNEDFEWLDGETEDQMAENYANELIQDAGSMTVSKIGFAKSSVDGQPTVWCVYTYTEVSAN
ncbi:MAG: hypothetical protein EGQ64_08600 [Ruminococcaceae bacterium]|nr:hypothetical protein [Oscillospiraceae bacterium]